MKTYEERIVAVLADTVQDLREQLATLRRDQEGRFRNAAEQRSFEQLLLDGEVHRKAGAGARDALRQIAQGLRSGEPLPDLVILDLCEHALAMEPLR